MSNKAKWLGNNLIFFAGVVSLLAAFFGCAMILGFLWMQYPAKAFIPYSLLVLELPLFALAAGVSKKSPVSVGDGAHLSSRVDSVCA